MADENLSRCLAKLGPLIVGWARMRLALGRPYFHLHELTDYVSTMSNGAPESTARVLRSLRAAGRVAYKCTSRTASRYVLRGVADDAQLGLRASEHGARER